MNDYERLLAELHEENKMLGVILWNVLNSHIDYDCAGIGNQPQASDYDSTKPQSIDFLFGTSSHGISVFKHPIDSYPFQISIPLDPTVEALKHTGTLSVTTVEPDGPETSKTFILTETKYKVSLTQLFKLLPHLTDTKIAPLMLSMLEMTDVDEYYAKKDDTGMWED